MIKIAICCRNEYVSDKIIHLLESGPLLTKVVATHSSRADMMNLLKEKLPDLVIFFFSNKSKKDINLLRDITHYYVGLPVLVVGNDFDDYEIAKVIKAGALGYLPEDQLPYDLALAVDTLASREAGFYNKSVADILSFEIELLNYKTRGKVKVYSG